MHTLLYTWTHCSFCTRAKALLERCGVEYDERVLDDDRATLRKLQARFGKRTMPFVFIDGEAVGGLAELEALEAAGDLGGGDQ